MNYTLNGTFPSFILMRPIFDGKKKKGKYLLQMPIESHR